MGKGGRKKNGGGGGQCRSRNRKGKQCLNTAVEQGFCANHVGGPQHVKKERQPKQLGYIVPLTSGPAQRWAMTQCGYVHPPDERIHRLRSFQRMYNVPGATRINVAMQLAGAPVSFLQGIIAQHHLPIDPNNPAHALAAHILLHVECPTPPSAFQVEHLNRALAWEQMQVCVDEVKQRFHLAFERTPDAVEFISRSITKWMDGPYASPLDDTFLPLIETTLPHEIQNELRYIFAGLVCLFHLETNESKTMLHVCNYITIEEWHTFWDYALREARHRIRLRLDTLHVPDTFPSVEKPLGQDPFLRQRLRLPLRALAL